MPAPTQHGLNGIGLSGTAIAAFSDAFHRRRRGHATSKVSHPACSNPDHRDPGSARNRPGSAPCLNRRRVRLRLLGTWSLDVWAVGPVGSLGPIWCVQLVRTVGTVCLWLGGAVSLLQLLQRDRL